MTDEKTLDVSLVYSRLNNLEVRLEAVKGEIKTDVLGVRTDVMSLKTEVSSLKDTIRTDVDAVKDRLQIGLENLNTSLTTIATAAIGKSNGFSGKDVLFLLMGVAVCLFGFLYGLKETGLLAKTLFTGQ